MLARRVELWDNKFVLPPAPWARAAVLAFGDELLDMSVPARESSQLPCSDGWLSPDGRSFAATYLLPMAMAALLPAPLAQYSRSFVYEILVLVLVVVVVLELRSLTYLWFGRQTCWIACSTSRRSSSSAKGRRLAIRWSLLTMVAGPSPGPTTRPRPFS